MHYPWQPSCPNFRFWLGAPKACFSSEDCSVDQLIFCQASPDLRGSNIHRYEGPNPEMRPDPCEEHLWLSCNSIEGRLYQSNPKTFLGGAIKPVCGLTHSGVKCGPSIGGPNQWVIQTNFNGSRKYNRRFAKKFITHVWVMNLCFGRHYMGTCQSSKHI